MNEPISAEITDFPPDASTQRVEQMVIDLGAHVREADQIIRKMQDDAKVIDDIIVNIKSRSSEVDEVSAHAGSASAETLTSLQTLLQEANETVALLKSRYDEIVKLNSDSSTLHEAITQLRQALLNQSTEISTAHSEALDKSAEISTNLLTVIKQNSEISTAHAEVIRIQSDVATTASRSSQNEQTTIAAATSATAHQQTASNAATVAAQNQADSSAALTQIQNHLKLASGLQSQTSEIFDKSKAIGVELEVAATNTKQVVQAVVDDKGSTENYRQTAEKSGKRVTDIEMKVTQASERVAALEQLIKNRDDELSNWVNRYEAFAKNIEGLLPGATSAGLAFAFRQQKESYFWPKIGYSALLICSALALAFGTHFVPEDDWVKKLTNPWQEMLAHVLLKSPIEVPLLLLLYFGFRGVTTADKLQQDYAYKERIASAFEGFKSQFASISVPAGSDSPISILCVKLLTIIGQHPARFFDPKHIEDLPSAQLAVKQMNGMFHNPTESEQEIADVPDALSTKLKEITTKGDV